MKASELRIGNLVYKNGIATEITADTMLDVLRYTTPFEPIPLTEEWLVKFGFKRFPWGLVIEDLLFRDDIRNSCKELWLEVGNGYRVHIKYLHQLQNLYFALTGKELTIKE